MIGCFVTLSVSDSQQNINILRGLAMQLQKIVNQEEQKCWGKPLGSENLWKGHVETIQRIQQMATQIKIKEVMLNQQIHCGVFSLQLTFFYLFLAGSRRSPKTRGFTSRNNI